MTGPDELARFWNECRAQLPGLPADAPAAWAFGATAEHADGLLALVLAGIKTGTASALWDIEGGAEPMPQEGELSIILDGAGAPRALIETTRIRVVPFGDVDAEHARAEGEGDRTLAHWRAVHERYWREHSENPRGFEPDMPVVCERFQLLHPVVSRGERTNSAGTRASRATIVESVVLPVVGGREAEFEAAFAQAAPLIACQPGYAGHTLRRGIENPSTFLLTVEWESVAAHTEGFRASAEYQEWKRLLHGFYDPFPTVLHYGEVL